MSATNQEIAIYETFVLTITAAEKRRQQASSLYVFLISTGYTLIGTIEDMRTTYILIPIIFISLIWWQTIIYFRNLAKAKFFVIGKMETGWTIKPFTDEYDKTKEINQNKIFHISLTYLEMAIPFLILVFSLVFLFYRIPYFYILNTLDSFLHIK